LNKKNLSNFLYLIKLKKKLNKQIFILKKLKNNKVDKKLSYFYLKKNKYELEHLINLILGVSMYKNKIVVFITNIKGKLLYFNTSGIMKIEKRKKKIDVVLKLLIDLINKKKFFKSNTYIALHFKNINQNNSNIISKFLFNNLKQKNIKIIKIINNKPHNGCRPKKIRRKKLNKLNFNDN